MEEGSKNIPETNGELVLKIRELRELITAIEEYKNYDKYIAEAEAERRKTEEAFNRWRTKRRFEKFFRASIRKAGLVSEHKKQGLYPCFLYYLVMYIFRHCERSEAI